MRSLNAACRQKCDGHIHIARYRDVPTLILPSDQAAILQYPGARHTPRDLTPVISHYHISQRACRGMLQALAFLCRLRSGSRPNVPYQRCEEKADNFRRMANPRCLPLCLARRAGRAKEKKTALRPKQKSFGRFYIPERVCWVQITTPFFLFFQFTFQEKRRL